jgi:hypothetical protein
MIRTKLVLALSGWETEMSRNTYAMSFPANAQLTPYG